MAAAIPLTGNHYRQFSMFCRCFGLRCISRATYQRVQRLYICPVVEKKWQDMQTSLAEEVKVKEVVAAGDGRMDSPGHCAQ